MSAYKILITGGAGFIGSAVIRHIIHDTPHSVMNIDKLTYASNLAALTEIDQNSRYQFTQIDICDVLAIRHIFAEYEPDIVMHLAAESHVDQSIFNPAAFIQTNIVGTYTLLEEAKRYWQSLPTAKQSIFRFHHISTDEVYGDLANDAAPAFTEQSSYAPSSPYSASKASSDHLVKAWHRTFGLPILITHCSNNYGPYQFPEKLIPTTILNALNGKKINVYGSGKQIRDWLYVDDHAKALLRVATQGMIGETYNIGGNCEKQNLETVLFICELLQHYRPPTRPGIRHYSDLITFVNDRPGHDVRYAINTQKIQTELNWYPEVSFETGIAKTIEWYMNKEPA